MRGNRKKQLAQSQRKALEDERSAESKLRREKRKAKGKAQDVAKAVQRSPAGRQAAAVLKGTRGEARKKEQASYQKRRARSATRLEGRRKQAQTVPHDRTEE
jgi:hypothetical protein